MQWILICLFAAPLWARGWWAYTPGGSTDDSTQGSLVAGYHPEQPFPFNHTRHAGELGIECQYCHIGARQGPVAGIPPMNTCAGCHKLAGIGKENVTKLMEQYERKEPFQWTQVNVLPDHVRFSHQPHVNAKNEKGEPLFSCGSCHGPVETKTTADQWAPLQMGWCIECHSQPKTTPNTPATHSEGVKTDKKTLAPISCQTCHY